MVREEEGLAVDRRPQFALDMVAVCEVSGTVDCASSEFLLPFSSKLVEYARLGHVFAPHGALRCSDEALALQAVLSLVPAPKTLRLVPT